LLLTALLLGVFAFDAIAVVTTFFNSNQVATFVQSGPTWDKVSCDGYVFQYSRDKFFTGGGPTPIGRPVTIQWPNGVQGQFITTPTASNATITITREDGGVFDLTSFTAHLLANAGAGRAIEIVPMLNGQEPFPDPFYFDVSGVYGQEFSYNTSYNPYGTTAQLTGYDTYIVGLSLDFALTAITLTDPSATGVETRTPAASNLRVAPNPANSVAHISIDTPGAQKIGVYSVTGARVRSFMLDASGRMDWDLRDDAGHRVVAGVYFVRVESAGVPSTVERLVVVK
jgi:hypothetical protein